MVFAGGGESHAHSQHSRDRSMSVGRWAALHTHSWYSWLEATASPDQLAARAAECGYTALALTDSNNLSGAVEFAAAGKRHGVGAILGTTLRHGNQRAVVLIAEPAGYHSLCRAISRLHFPLAQTSLAA